MKFLNSEDLRLWTEMYQSFSLYLANQRNWKSLSEHPYYRMLSASTSGSQPENHPEHKSKIFSVRVNLVDILDIDTDRRVVRLWWMGHSWFQHGKVVRKANKLYMRKSKHSCIPIGYLGVSFDWRTKVRWGHDPSCLICHGFLTIHFIDYKW